MSSKLKRIQKNIVKNKSLEATKEISDNLIMMGHCKCGAPIFSYIDTTSKKSRFDMYCMGCGYVSDVRFPRSEDEFFMKHPHSPLELLVAAYKEKGVNITDKEIEKAPRSKYVGTYRTGSENKNEK